MALAVVGRVIRWKDVFLARQRRSGRNIMNRGQRKRGFEGKWRESRGAGENKRKNIVLSLARFRDMHIGSRIGEMEV